MADRAEIADLALLAEPMSDGDIALVPLAEAHREALKAACAEDADVWTIYAISYDPDHFDATFDWLRANPKRIPFAILIGGKVAGMSAWIDANAAFGTAEIGNTYIAPSHRGSDANERIKKLMLDRGFAAGLKRIQLCVDARNQRSQAACAKIGAVREGVIRNHMITWTGHERDTVVFSFIAREWPSGIWK